ncbi:HEAT repeat domain-containing protein [Streptomyces sp. B8F3]|uniref:HEAT repeat domain-containing protein n=1 Tax=Streptomyces sp. B8F3 TaxID=3153573 RepID=UPI00325E5FD9
MNWWKTLRTALAGGEKHTGPWCDACRRRVPGPVTKPPPPGMLSPFYVGAPGRVGSTVVREACDDCWRRHRELTAEGEADYRRKHPVGKYVAALRDRDLSVREDAARVLASLRDPRAVEPLITAIRSEMHHPRVERSYHVSALMFALADTGGEEARRFLDALLRAPASWRELHRPDFYPLVPAVDWVAPALAVLGDTVMLRPLLDLLAEDRPDPVRRTTAQHLVRLTNGGAGRWSVDGPVVCEITAEGRRMFTAGMRAAADDADETVRRYVRSALAQVGTW